MMAASPSLMPQGNEEDEMKWVVASLVNIPPWIDFKIGTSDKYHTFTEKNGFLGRIPHLIKIGFCWDSHTEKLSMGVQFICAVLANNDHDPVVRVEKVSVRFDKVNLKKDLCEGVVPPAWSGSGCGKFFAIEVRDDDAPLRTDAFVEIHVIRGNRTAALGSGSSDSDVEIIDNDQDPEKIQICRDNQKRGPAATSSNPSPSVDEFSDTKIECGDGTMIPVHRLVLSRACEFFARMMGNDTQEGKSGVIKIHGFSTPCVKELLRFIYTGNVQKLSSELFMAADKYGLEELKKLCVPWLMKSIKVENAVEMYEFGRKYGNDMVKMKAMKLIQKNKRKWITDEATLKEFSSKYPKLMLDLLKI